MPTFFSLHELVWEVHAGSERVMNRAACSGVWYFSMLLLCFGLGGEVWGVHDCGDGGRGATLLSRQMYARMADYKGWGAGADAEGPAGESGERSPSPEYSSEINLAHEPVVSYPSELILQGVMTPARVYRKHAAPVLCLALADEEGQRPSMLFSGAGDGTVNAWLSGDVAVDVKGKYDITNRGHAGKSRGAQGAHVTDRGGGGGGGGGLGGGTLLFSFVAHSAGVTGLHLDGKASALLLALLSLLAFVLVKQVGQDTNETLKSYTFLRGTFIPFRIFSTRIPFTLVFYSPDSVQCWNGWQLESLGHRPPALLLRERRRESGSKGGDGCGDGTGGCWRGFGRQNVWRWRG